MVGDSEVTRGVFRLISPRLPVKELSEEIVRLLQGTRDCLTAFPHHGKRFLRRSPECLFRWVR